MWMLLTLLPALAGVVDSDYLYSISDPIPFDDVDGGWVKAFYIDDAWTLMSTRGEHYMAFPLTESGGQWTLGTDGVVLSTNADANDHCVRRCPDGTFLHVASVTVNDHDDSAYGYTYDADLQLIAESVIERSNAAMAHNDPNCDCSDLIRGVTFSEAGMAQGNWFYPLDEDAAPAGDPFQISETTRAAGGTTWSDTATDRVIMAGLHQDTQLYIQEFNADLDLLQETPISVLSSPWQDFWLQSMIRVGDVFFAALLGRDPQQGGEYADVFLVVLDEQWHVLETHRVSHDGASRPALAIHDDRILLTTDKNNSPQLFVIELNPTGADDDPTDGDGDGDGDVSVTGGCGGCTSAHPSPWRLGLSLAGALGLISARRRPRSHPRRPR